MKTSTIQRTTLIIAMFAAFIFPFAGSSMNIAIPLIGQEFSVAATHLSWVVSAMMLTNIALSVPFGRFADLWGKRRVFNIGIFVFFVATLLATFSWNFAALIVCRIFQGIGAAMLVSTNNAILMDVFPATERGRVLGLSVMCTYSGLAVGPVFSGYIVEYLGWRAVFTVTAAVTLVVFIIAVVSAARLPKAGADAAAGVGAGPGDIAGAGAGAGATAGAGAQKAQNPAIDPVSIAIYMVAMLATMYGLTIFSQNVFSYISLGVGLVLLVVFAIHASKIERPVIQIRLFRNNRRYVMTNIVALLHYAATFALGYLMSIYLQVVKGYPADISGLILISQPLMMAIISPIIGRLSDRISPFKISTIGIALCAVAMISFLFIDADASLMHIIINLLAVGIGFGIFSSPNTNAALSCVTPKEFGVANSILATMRSSGQLISMAIITIVIHFTIGDMLIADAGNAGIMLAFRVSFVVFGIICLVGVALSMLRGRTQPAPK